MIHEPSLASDGDDFVGALTRLARRLVPGAAEIAGLKRLSGGASQETWAFAAKGLGTSVPLILRRSPRGREQAATALPLETEALLMRLAGEAGIPSPRVLHVLAPDDGLGHGFVMAHVEGETLGRRIVRDPALAAVRPGLARRCGEVLARIHALAPRSAPGLEIKSARVQIDYWHRVHRADGWPRPVFELAVRWLNERAPDAPSPPKLLHGDFRTGNLIIGPDGLRAVLDWELAQYGDPMQDLGWICVNSWRFGAIDLPVGGFGRREDLFAGYEAAGGGKVEVERVHYWEVLGTLRWGIICASATGKFRGGADRSVERPMIARRTSETEIDLLSLLAPRA